MIKRKNNRKSAVVMTTDAVVTMVAIATSTNLVSSGLINNSPRILKVETRVNLKVRKTSKRTGTSTTNVVTTTVDTAVTVVTMEIAGISKATDASKVRVRTPNNSKAKDNPFRRRILKTMRLRFKMNQRLLCQNLSPCSSNPPRWNHLKRTIRAINNPKIFNGTIKPRPNSGLFLCTL